jgi:DNA-3-methyladenine glycosylase
MRKLLRGPAHLVAPTLLGALLRSDSVSGSVVARIVEVEAYGGVGEDPGSHAFRGQTARNSIMFAGPGLAYVYFTYGMHWCMNVTTGPAGTAGAVLIRAATITSGQELARSRRPGASDRDLGRGPARLSRAMGVDGRLDGVDLLSTTSPLRLIPGESVAQWATSPRTGVGGDGATTPWRFYLPDEPTVSPYRPHQRRAGGRDMSRLARE